MLRILVREERLPPLVGKVVAADELHLKERVKEGRKWGLFKEIKWMSALPETTERYDTYLSLLSSVKTSREPWELCQNW